MIGKWAGNDGSVRESDCPGVSSSSSSASTWLSTLHSVPTELTPIAGIQPGPGVRDEAGTDSDYVHLLAESIAELPAIIVHRPTMRLIDGAHRLAAMQSVGRDLIAVRFFDGSENDAYALAVHSNVVHGLPLSVGARKTAAVRLMQSHPRWSDRLIARTTGLTHKTVGVLRNCANGGDSRPDSRVGRDGKVRPMDAERGRRIAAEIIRDRPTASLREVARIAGISPSTVRDVRQRLSRGESPGSSAGDENLAPAAVANLHQKILGALQRDPALRFNDKGRAILRLLTTSVGEILAWQNFAGDVPRHCRGPLARLARANAQSWIELADSLERLERIDRATG